MPATDTNIKYYYPNSLFIPPEINITREMPGQQHLPAKIKSALVDSHLLFHDIFYLLDNRAIMAIGPPQYNLRKRLPLLKITSGGVSMRYYCWRVWGNVPLEMLVINSGHLRREATAELTFHYGFFEQTLVVRANTSDARQGGIMLTTLQKNNQPHWIFDWLQWHHRLHGVSRAILYDNGSDNFAEVLQKLEELEESLELWVVQWHFAFGRFKSGNELFGHSLGKHAALNHALYRFGNCRWLLNLDVDEYLMGKTSLSLHLQKAPKTIYSIEKEIEVVNTEVDEIDLASSSFWDYSTWVKNSINRHTKYVCRTDKTLLLDVHRAYGLSCSEPPRGKRSSFIRMFLAKLLSKTWHRLTLLGHYRISKYLVKKILPGWCRRQIKYLLLSRFPQDTLPAESFAMLHYRGLNTQWKTAKRSRRHTFNPELHYRDESARQLARQQGMKERKAGHNKS